MRSWITPPFAAAAIAAATVAVAAVTVTVVERSPEPKPAVRAAATSTPKATGVATATSGSPAVAGRCTAADNCFPKPPGKGLGATGIPPGTSLKPCGGSETISNNNAVIDSCVFTGSLTITGTHVTIRRSRIMGSIEGAETGTYTITDSEIGPDSGCASEVALLRWQNYTARRNYLHGNGDGMRFAGNNIVAKDNFIATCDLPGDHSDGIQGNTSGKNNAITHNTIDLSGSVNGPNAALFFADDSKSAKITDNLLIARSRDSVALKVNDDHSPDVGPWVVTGNRLQGLALTTNTECRAATMTWAGNRQVTVNRMYGITSTRGVVNCR